MSWWCISTIDCLSLCLCWRDCWQRHDLLYMLVLYVPTCWLAVSVRLHGLTWSNSSRSTSPSPFRSNILKAISKFLWGAGHKHTHTKNNQKSMQHNIKAKVLTAQTGVVNPFFDITAIGLQNDCHKITTINLFRKWILDTASFNSVPK